MLWHGRWDDGGRRVPTRWHKCPHAGVAALALSLIQLESIPTSVHKCFGPRLLTNNASAMQGGNSICLGQWW